MAVVLFRPQARLDLKEFYRYIAEVNPVAAAKVVREVAGKAAFLGENPTIGQPVDHLFPELRRFPIGNFLIFYRPTQHGIEVVRILHGARDIETILHDDLP